MTKQVLSILCIVAIISSGCGDDKPDYRYAVGSYVPDSLRDKYAEWVKQAISASNYHMTGGDYEDPEDVIRQAEQTGKRIFSIQTEGIEILYDGFWEFIPKHNLSPGQLIIFNKVKQ